MSEMFWFGAGAATVLLAASVVVWLIGCVRESQRRYEYTHERLGRAFDRIAEIERTLEKRGER